jgi:hypothetical protein
MPDNGAKANLPASEGHSHDDAGFKAAPAGDLELHVRKLGIDPRELGLGIAPNHPIILSVEG